MPKYQTPLALLRSRAAFAILWANTSTPDHSYNPDNEIAYAMAQQIDHIDPRQMTRKECQFVLGVAHQYGYSERGV